MGAIETGAVGIFAFCIVVVGKLLKAADAVADGIRDAPIGDGSAGALAAVGSDAARAISTPPTTIGQLFGKRAAARQAAPSITSTVSSSLV